MAAASMEAATITYSDKTGRVVNIPVPVKRVVDFQTIEMIPALGIWDKIVGIGRWAYDNDLIRATKPDIEKTIPSAAASGGDVNIEVLLKLKPDLVIIASNKPESIRFMEEKGIRVLAVFPENLEELYDLIRLHGRLFGKGKKAEHSIEAMERIFNLINDRVSKVPGHRKMKVLWLGGKPTSVASGIGITNDVINIVGGINPASAITQGYGFADVSLEQIVVWNPDVIFISGYPSYTAEDILTNPQWRYIKAVRDGKVYKGPPRWSTWSPRLAPVALWAAMKTYPDYFKDVNFERVADDFFRKTYGIPYAKVRRIGD
jgi:iron complex transport system substrate-binding protein